MCEKRKENILIVHNSYQIPGGEDTVVINERRMLEKRGHKVYLYMRNNSELNNYNLIQKILFPFQMIFNIKTYLEVKRIIRNENIDIVHVHNTLAVISSSVYYAALRCKKPVIQTIHNFRLLCPGATFYRDGHICEDCLTKGLFCAVKYHCYRKSWIQSLACVISTKMHRATGIYGRINYICLTEFNRSKLLHIKDIKESQVFLKPNFVDNIDNIVPYKLRPNTFIFAGRVDKLKGIDILLEAWVKMGVDAPELLICGDGPMVDWCNDYIDYNQLDMVKMMGYISNDEVKKLISMSRALILPTQWYEGFPMTIVESFATGTPVIGANIGNVGTLIEDGVNGLKFEYNSATSLAECVLNIANKSIRPLLTYEQMYSEAINYDIIRKIYKGITSKKG